MFCGRLAALTIAFANVAVGSGLYFLKSPILLKNCNTVSPIISRGLWVFFLIKNPGLKRVVASK